jgi:hypothetical protein
MLTLTVATGEEIARSISKQIQEEKKMFFTIGGNNENSPSTSSSELLVQLMTAIETRQAHMIQRAQYMTKQKMHSFFDEAPATFNEQDDNNKNNIVVGANY